MSTENGSLKWQRYGPSARWAHSGHHPPPLDWRGRLFKHAEPVGMVEARGVEPLSWRPFAQASTCLAASWCFGIRTSVRQFRFPRNLFNLVSWPGSPALSPACWWSRTAVAGVRQSTSLSI